MHLHYTTSHKKFPSSHCTGIRFSKEQVKLTLGMHSKPPPVALSKANDKTLPGAIDASLLAIIAPVSTEIAV